MKSSFLAITFAAALVGVSALHTESLAVTIAEWTFETNTPADTNNIAVFPDAIPADVGVGNASAAHAGAGTDYSTPTGNGSANSFSANTWAIGDYFQFQVNTTGLQDIQLRWDQGRSSTGPATFDLEYSTDGSSFTTALNDYAVSDNAAGAGGALTAWSSVTFNSGYRFTADLSAVAAIENQSTVYFRLTSQVDPADAGTARVDNFLVEATAIPEPSTIFLVTASLGLFWTCGRRRR